MELKELTEKVLVLFNSKNTTELIKKLPSYWNDNDVKAKFKSLVGDLSVDWLQKIFQYYEADRKEKKQDYTPTTLAKLMATLALRGGEDHITDMCAGSGALTIQCWNDISNSFYKLQKGGVVICHEQETKWSNK